MQDPERECSRRIGWLVGILAAIAVYSAVWPAYRSCQITDIIGNEAWNAYSSDAAFQGAKLYPASDELTTNNYPPLSFYIVGSAGALVGDTVFAGRWISLIAIGMIAVGVGFTIRQLGGSRMAAGIGGLYFVGTFCRFFTMYAGMNDPQLLAHAMMVFGFVAFLKAVERDRGYFWPIFLMVVTGFVKHNIVTMPVVAFLWLGIQHPKRFLPNAAVAVSLIAAGFAVCRAAYGPDFFPNMLAPRKYSLCLMLIFVGHLQFVAVGLIGWLCVGIPLRRDPTVKLCNMLVAVALGMFLLQKSGEGLGENAQFDLIIAVSIAVGVAFARTSDTPVAKRIPAERLRFALLLAIVIRLLACEQIEPVRLVFDSGFRREIAERTQIMKDCIGEVRNVPGKVMAPPILTYRAGKPFVVDSFNLDQRIKAGVFPLDIVQQRIAAGEFVKMNLDPRHSWLVAYPGD